MVRISAFTSALAMWAATAAAAPPCSSRSTEEKAATPQTPVAPSSVTSSANPVGTAPPTTKSGSSGGRFIMYFDQWHTAVLPNKTMTAGITHVITAFANSSLFTTDPVGEYVPFMELDKVRALFDENVKVSMAIGGWGDNAGFRLGARSAESRALYAKNIAATIEKLGYDGVDMDWEYPVGNGADYKQVPNDESEIETYPLLLAEIKKAIGEKELSIAVPALERDMLAYTPAKVPEIDAAVDYVNVMTYDLINRRDTASKHHTDIKGSLAAIDAYIQRGFQPAKLTLGIAFYAKYFTLQDAKSCTEPIGCPLAPAEFENGTDANNSGAQTFEASSFPVVVDTSNLKPSTDGSCGGSTGFTCEGTTWGTCCSKWGFCGVTTDHCGTDCQLSFGTCTASDAPVVKPLADSFKEAFDNGVEDVENGGQWYVDTESSRFWTWDTPALVQRKFTEIIAARGLGGIMAWSMAEDSYDWRLLAAMQEGVKNMVSAN
ncbi:putative chitinase 3 [Ceratocystis platani]|uniref:chitinase n=1 Tax=Ceratocystis fimbriata f. sp. platani TaxID=88771 RepID=A0A0F8B1U2_CERFI|nr:putative chitinase 3 [Ceratocystis platani]